MFYPSVGGVSDADYGIHSDTRWSAKSASETPATKHIELPCPNHQLGAIRMNRSLLFTCVAIALSLAVSPSTHADDPPVQRGGVPIDWREQLNAEPKVSVNLNQALLKFATAAASEAATEIPGMREIIGQLALVKVEVYQGIASEKLTAEVESNLHMLSAMGWTTVVRAVGDDGERVNVLMLPNNDSIAGLIVIAEGSSEMAFVQVAGDIDPETLGKHLGALARLTHNGKVKLEDLINPKVLEALIEESSKGTKTTRPAKPAEHDPFAPEEEENR